MSKLLYPKRPPEIALRRCKKHILKRNDRRALENYNGLPFSLFSQMVVWWWFTQVQSNKQHRTTLNKSKYYVCVSPVSTYFHNHLQLKIVGAYPLLGTTLRETRRRGRLKFKRGKWFCREAPQTPWQKYWVLRCGKLPVLKQNWQLGNKFSSVSVKRLPCKNKQLRIWCQLWSGWSHDFLLTGRSVKDT